MEDEKILEELETISAEIKNKNAEVSKLEARYKSLQKMLGTPDIVGKCIYVKGDLNDYCVKVNNITNTEHLGNIVEGVGVEATYQLRGISYVLKSNAFYPITPETKYEIISEDKFEKQLSKAIDAMKSK